MIEQFSFKPKFNVIFYRFHHYLKEYSSHEKWLKSQEHTFIMLEILVLEYEGLLNAVRIFQKIMIFVKLNKFPFLLWFEYVNSALQSALEIVVESRKHLMLTYIFAYYAKQHSQKDSFESIDRKQDCLVAVTKSLSNYLEQILRNRKGLGKGTLIMDAIAVRTE